jgi:PqqD family protein of HPr-rel-A system
LRRSARLYARNWETEHVVFDEVSGDTHCLPSTAYALLELVQRHGRIDVDSLIAAASSAGSSTGPESATAVGQKFVQDLIRLRLIESDD